MNESSTKDQGLPGKASLDVLGRFVIGFLAALLVIWLLPLVPQGRSDNALRRGSRMVESLGCLSCHGAPGSELANPGSDTRRVPSLLERVNPGMEKSWLEVEEWIRDGHPAGLRENPVAWERHLARRIHMPSFAARLNEQELETLVLWTLIAGGHVVPRNPAAVRGERLARETCLPCHGVGGAGGDSNPGSVSGYVPALWGPDFDDLVRDEGELREWITTGGSARIAAIPGVLRWWRRQTIRMPAFGGELSEGEMEDLLTYLGWLRETEGGIGAARAGREGIDDDS